MFPQEFATSLNDLHPGNIFCDGEWAILEWKYPLQCAAAGFFMWLMAG